MGDTIRDTGKALTDAENWKAMGQAVVQTRKDLVGSPLQSARRWATSTATWPAPPARWWEPCGHPPDRDGQAIIGYDNWEKAMDPNVPVTERIGRTLVGIAAALNLTGARAGGR